MAVAMRDSTNKADLPITLASVQVWGPRHPKRVQKKRGGIEHGQQPPFVFGWLWGQPWGRLRIFVVGFRIDFRSEGEGGGVGGEAASAFDLNYLV